MTLKELQGLVQDIINASDDDEVAHSLEDTLREMVLREVANGNPDSRDLAEEVLKTSDIEFQRWYA